MFLLTKYQSKLQMYSKYRILCIVSCKIELLSKLGRENVYNDDFFLFQSKYFIR